MLWGCMSAEGAGEMCIVNGRVNAEAYTAIMEAFLIPSQETLYGDTSAIFQQDNASSHKAKTVMQWFKTNKIDLLEWPANSPDLNPIENVWRTMKKRLQASKPTTKMELVAELRKVWATLTCKECSDLVASMPRRICAVIRSRGHPTKY